jgi:nitroreductase
VLEATAMELGTCWVGGFFRKSEAAKVLRIGRREKVFAVTPVGRAVDSHTLEERTMKALARSHQRRSLVELVDPAALEKAPGWMVAALEAARVAPSAVNRQPWRFRLGVDRITVSVDRPGFHLGISKRLDCGIAMLHIEVAAIAEGVRGTWELLESPGVASFVADVSQTAT